MLTPGWGAVRFQACGRRVELRQPIVHQPQGEADSHRRNHYADEKCKTLIARRGSHKEPGLQVLRSIARLGRCDANHSADGDGKSAECRRGPAVDQEDGRGGHQRSDGHAGDGVSRAADQPHDARADGNKEKSEKDDEDGCGQVGPYADLRSRHRLEDQEEKHEDDRAEWSRR